MAAGLPEALRHLSVRPREFHPCDDGLRVHSRTGKMVGEVFSSLAVAAVFFASAVLGAVVYTAIPATNLPLIGGYPAVYGLVGAFTWLLWTRLGMANANRMGAFSLIGMLLGIQLIFGVMFGGGWDWIAELTGFATGFGLSFFVAPGGFKRALERLRQR